MSSNIVKIALRNITRQKKRSILLGSAITFGVMIIILLNSFTAGLTETIQENFTSLMGGHVYVNGTEVTSSGKVVHTIGDKASLDKALEKVQSDIKEIHVRTQASQGEIIFGSKSTRMLMYGVDWEEEKLLKKTLILKEGSFDALSDPKAVIIPETVAEKLGVKAGESVLLRFDTVTGQRNVGDFVVGAVSKETSGFSFVSAGYADITYLGTLLGLGEGEYQYVNLYLNDIHRMDAVAAELTSELKRLALVDIPDEKDTENNAHQKSMGFFMGGSTKTEDPWEGTKFSVSTLNDVMEPVLQMINILNAVALTLFIILLTITMVGLLNTFRMVLIERTREIGTLRAIGMHKKDIRNIFLFEALFLSLAGALAGLVIALIISTGVGAIAFKPESSLGFFLLNRHLLFITTFPGVMKVVVILSGMTLISVYLPARKAAQLKVADALRTQY